MPTTNPSIEPLGLDGLLVRFSLRVTDQASAAVQAFAGALDAAPIAGVVDVVPALASVLVRFDQDRTTRAAVAGALADITAARDWSQVIQPTPRRIWRIPVALGGTHGPELAEAAALAGLREDEAIAQITAADLRVLAIGFAPGQPYLGLLPATWDMPRKSSLTSRVPAGALVVAVRQVVLFANPSPTGWRQIGYTPFRPFDQNRADPAPLRAGDGLRLVAVSAVEIDALDRAGDRLGGARCEVRP